nr:MAG TPA: hypothetical protein [Caudoviricetes sp.]
MKLLYNVKDLVFLRGLHIIILRYYLMPYRQDSRFSLAELLYYKVFPVSTKHNQIYYR